MNTYDCPKISIITVCYNESAAKIHETFDNISSQDYPDIEWIVVDGGSGEETLAAIGEYADRIDVLISEPDNGIYDAMNKGVARATGEFISFMNVGDEYLERDTLSRIMEAARVRPDCDCFYGDVLCVDQTSGRSWIEPQIRPVSRFRLYYLTVCHQSALTRRALYDRIGGFDLKYLIVADRQWIIRSLDVGAKWLHVEMCICRFDQGGISSDIAKREAEIAKLLREQYSLSERVIFSLGWWLIRLGWRICRTLKMGRAYRLGGPIR
ncbi:MAG: glycosyltransferase [Armatimonadetes bacterium]|nr:glycosyltransferase [Armatimonadota bacterium]